MPRWLIRARYYDTITFRYMFFVCWFFTLDAAMLIFCYATLFLFWYDVCRWWLPPFWYMRRRRLMSYAARCCRLMLRPCCLMFSLFVSPRASVPRYAAATRAAPPPRLFADISIDFRFATLRCRCCLLHAAMPTPFFVTLLRVAADALMPIDYRYLLPLYYGCWWLLIDLRFLRWLSRVTRPRFDNMLMSPLLLFQDVVADWDGDDVEPTPMMPRYRCHMRYQAPRRRARCLQLQSHVSPFSFIFIYAGQRAIRQDYWFSSPLDFDIFVYFHYALMIIFLPLILILRFIVFMLTIWYRYADCRSCSSCRRRRYFDDAASAPMLMPDMRRCARWWCARCRHFAMSSPSTPPRYARHATALDVTWCLPPPRCHAADFIFLHYRHYLVCRLSMRKYTDRKRVCSSSRRRHSSSRHVRQRWQ